MPYSNRRDWSCRHCNRNNWGRNGHCFNCRSRKPVRLLQGDWYCADCGEFQFANRTQCRRCGCGHREPSTTEIDDLATRFERFAERLHETLGVNINSTITTDDTVADNQEEACVICLTNKRSITLVHGDTGHFVVCKQCSLRIDKCPVCRKHINSKIRSFA